jgi:hypothetical protein
MSKLQQENLFGGKFVIITVKKMVRHVSLTMTDSGRHKIFEFPQADHPIHWTRQLQDVYNRKVKLKWDVIPEKVELSSS